MSEVSSLRVRDAWRLGVPDSASVMVWRMTRGALAGVDAPLTKTVRVRPILAKARRVAAT